MSGKQDGRRAGAGAESETTPLLPGTEEYKRSRDSNFLRMVFPPLVLYIVGVLALMWYEGWPLLTANYVIAQIVTTVGYGDFTVTSDGAKIFMAFYSITVLVVVAYSVNILVASLVTAKCDHLRQYLRQAEQKFAGVESEKEAKEAFVAANKVIASMIMFLLAVGLGTIFFRLYEHCTCGYGKQIVVGCSERDYATCKATGGLIKNWADCFYMSTITMTTIGFGDYQPRTSWGHLLGSIWMVLGVGATAGFLGAMTTYMYEASGIKAFSQADVLGGITEDTFDKIDRDKSGTLSRGEYLAYTLMRYGLIDENLVNEINVQFDNLDTENTNCVTLDDIKRKQRILAAEAS